MTRHFAAATITQAAPGYRELRIDIREQGQTDPCALIAVRPMHDTPDVLAAFGWCLAGPLEYVVGPNEERADVTRCEPADHDGAEALRNTVRREIRARALARLVHPDARHFHPVLPTGDHSVDPIGWTFVTGTGDQHTHSWVTAAGRVADGVLNTIRAEATRNVRGAHMMRLEPVAAHEAAYAWLQEQAGPDLSRLLLAVRNGVDLPRHAKPTANGDAADGPFREGDRIVCPDGVTRTVTGMAPAVTGKPARVVVEGGSEWNASSSVRANWSDILDAHRRSNAAAARIRTKPDPADPEWHAALTKLGEALNYLRKADPTVQVALAEDDARDAAKSAHADACGFQPIHNTGEDEPVAWTFRTGHGARTRYGVVTRTAEVAPIGLYEYPTTAEIAYHQHTAQQTR
ncbi:hypothetical protein AB0H23_32715 [Streptomyces albogriseolus]|uniref:hypothetical protein n=1 Tax=Streptomyces albogriseolus TaxID=1887 RepID=UPI00346042E8